MGVVLATTVDLARIPAGVRAGIGGAAESPDRSWLQARAALRFTTPRRPVVPTRGWERWSCSRRCPRTPCGATPMWSRSTGSPVTGRI
ncbi:hypothetical protein [Streptomyces sp. NPDC003379]